MVGKSGLHIQYTHTEERDQQFEISRFSFQVYYSLRDKRGKHRSFFSMIDPAATAFGLRHLQRSFAGLQKEGLTWPAD